MFQIIVRGDLCFIFYVQSSNNMTLICGIHNNVILDALKEGEHI